jgi:hypothetical protein
MKFFGLDQRVIFWLAVGGLIIGWVALTAIAIPLYPTPVQDEVVWSTVALNFLRDGRFGIDVWADPYGFSQNYVLVGRLFAVYLAAMFRVFGFGLAQARWAVALAAFGSAALLALAMTRLYSPRYGLAAAALCLFSWNMFFWSHYVRPEVVSLLGGLAVFYWFLYTRETRSPWVIFGWGLANALLLDIHFSHAHLFIALEALIIADTFGRRAWHRLLWLGLGHTLGGVYLVAAHLYPDPQAALQQLALLGSSVSASAGISNSSLFDRWRVAAAHFTSQFVTLTRLSFWQFALMIIGWAIVIRHWRRHLFIFLPTLSLLFTIFVIFPNQGHATYTVMLLPWLSAAMVVAAAEWHTYFNRLASPLARLGRWAYGAALGLLFAGYVAGNIVLTWNNRLVNYAAMAEQLAQLAPRGVPVLAETIWFYSYHDGEFVDTAHVIRLLANSTTDLGPLDEFFASRKIKYVFVQANLLTDFADWLDARMIIYATFAEYVADRCQYRGTVAGSLYGADLGAADQPMVINVYDCRP